MDFVCEDNQKTLEKVIEAFKDTEQTDQYDKNCEILRINYDDYSKTINNFFRTILKTNEISLRVFNLTTLIITTSATNYMAWLVRRKCIDRREEIKIDLDEECDWLDSITVQNQKNYQIWHHRKFISELTKDYIRELNIIREVFLEEPKNYHAWCHRIWLVRRFDLYLQEFDFVKKMLDRDLRNNSAWNYRFFLVSSCHDITLKSIQKSFNNENLDNIEKDIQNYNGKILLDSEVEFAVNYLLKDPENESVYSYIRGLYDNEKINFNKKKLLCENKFLIEKICEITSKNKNCYQSRSLKLDIIIEERNLLSKQLDDLTVNNDLNNSNKIESLKTKIVSLESEILIEFEGLKEIDYIREKYWLWRKDNFESTLIKL